MSDKSFLGTGWSFPPQFDKTSQSVVMVSDNVDIQESLKVILTTKIGERVMQPTFGTDLDSMVFEPVNLSLLSLVKDIIEKSIQLFEPRIEIESVTVEQNPEERGLVEANIDYIIRSTNTRSNIVYPFYLNEGNNINS